MVVTAPSEYWLRAATFDDVLNMSSSNIRRVKIVVPEADVIDITDFLTRCEVPFEIYLDDVEATLTATVVKKTEHPLAGLVFQYALESAPDDWQDIQVYAADDLKDLNQGDTKTATWNFNFADLREVDNTKVLVRVVATNALGESGKYEQTPVEVKLIPEECAVPPEVLFLGVDAPDTNPDSSAPRGTVSLRAYTAAKRSKPAIKHILFEIFDGTNWVALGGDFGGDDDGIVTVGSEEEVTPQDDLTLMLALTEAIAAGEMKEADLTASYNRWTLNWDTTKVDDSIECGATPPEECQAEARDFTKDAEFPPGPYMVRALAVDVNDERQDTRAEEPKPAPEKDVSVDNIDDVPPVTGTEIILIERETIIPGVFEEIPADNKAFAKVRVTAQPKAEPETFDKVVLIVKSEDEAFSLELTLDENYQVTIDTRKGTFTLADGTEVVGIPNGTYTLQALAEDEAENREIPDEGLIKTVVIANIVPPEAKDATLTHVAGEPLPRPIRLDAPVEVRPVSGISIIEAQVEAQDAYVYIGAEPLPPDQGIDENDPDVTVTKTDGGFTFEWNTVPRGTDLFYVSVRFIAGPPLPLAERSKEYIENVETIVDNTNPTINIVSPEEGSTVLPKPTITASYFDQPQTPEKYVHRVEFKLLDEAGNVELEGSAGESEATVGEGPNTKYEPFEVLDDEGLHISGTELTYTPPTFLEPGDYTAMITVTDRARNEATATVSFTVGIDVTPPRVTIVSPHGTIRKTSVTLALSVFDESGFGKVIFYLNGDEIDEVEPVDGSASTEVVDLKPGEQQVEVQVFDVVGNETKAKWSFFVELPPPDTTPPQITIVSPQGTVFKPDPILIVNATDESGIRSVTFELKDELDTVVPVGQVNLSGDVATVQANDLLKNGEYTVDVTVTDKVGNESKAKWSFIVKLDTTPPQITSVSPQGTIYESNTTLIVSASDESGIAEITFKLDGNDLGAGALVDGVATMDVKDLAKGEHRVEATVSDNAGNAAKAEWSFIVQPDTTPPQITAVSPQGTINKDNTTLIVSATDESGIKSIAFKLNGTDLGEGDLADGVATKAVTGLKSGEQRVEATVTDNADNSAKAEWSFVVQLDTTPPQITVVAPQGTINEDSATLSATATDESGIASIKFKLDGKNLTGEQLANGAATVKATNLESGEHHVEVTATDKAGNSAQAKWSFFVQLDTTPPQITAVSPQGTIYVDSVTLSASATDESGIASIKFKIDGSNLSGEQLTNGTATVTAPNLTSGEHQVEVTVTDKAVPTANTSTAKWSFMVRLDTIPPAITATAPHGLVREEKPTISVTAFDDISGVDDITIELFKGKSTRKGNTTVSPDGSSATFVPTSALDAGTYNVKAEVTDQAGNAASGEWRFTVEFDEIPPVITIVSPQDGARFTEKQVEKGLMVSATYSDNLAGVNPKSVKLELDGKPVNANATATQVIYKHEAKLELGVHTVKLELEDNDKNEATQEWQFFVEYEKGLILNARNYPNPFSGNTTIAFRLSKQAQVTIKIYDFSGRLVKLLTDNEVMEVGPSLKDLTWDGTTDDGDELADGVYLCQIIMKTDELESRQVVLKMVKFVK
jgi:hypothetical protein